MELETQFKITIRLGFIDDADFERAKGLLSEVTRMLNTLAHSLIA